MIIPLEFFNYLRQQVRLSDIVRQKIALTKKGHEYSGLCPFHSEKTPSFSVNDSKGFYHCFGCGVGGDVIKFVSELDGFSYSEAAIKIAQDNGIELPKMTSAQKKKYEEADQIYSILELAAVYFATGITKEVKEYLDKRGISEEARKQWLIGYTHNKGELIKYFENKSIPLKDLLNSGLVGKKEDGRIYEVFTNRIMFPIRNIYNKVVGFGGRVIGDALPKYINSPETLVFKKSETMYGENIAISASYKKNYVIIVEGYMDVITLNKAGINEAVASLGTSVTEQHLQKLWKSADEIIVCLDGDSAGQRASNKLINMSLPMIAHNKKLSFIKLPDEKDPDDIINHGRVGLFNSLLTSRVDLSKIIWQNEYESKVFSSAEEKTLLEQNLMEYCNQIKDKTLAINFRRYFKEQIWQNLYNNKGQKNALRNANKTYIKNNNDKQYTEMEVIELSLCSFMILFPNILKTSATKEFISDVVLSSDELGEFKDWFIDQLEEYEDFSKDKAEELIKNTRFYDSFLVLSDPNKMFLDVGFINKKHENCELIFDWLSKKHYLLSLKQEYINLMSDPTEDAEQRASFFLKEIQETSKELVRLNEFFMN